MVQPLNFKRWNNLTGAAVWLISFLIYFLSLEPTASFWDCGEFLACSARLEVCHPPGAPLFLLVGRLASLFASNPQHIAICVNTTSAIASAFTILFLFWTITWFGRKLTANWESSSSRKIGILAAGFCGAMAYAVSDSFWFSAVEAEVYAMSSLFTAAVFWCILKWEETSEEKNSSRWLMLIAYLFGLSVGVHLLNLLAIPAIVFVYFFKLYPANKRNILKASIASVVILAAILYGVIPGIPKFLSWTELVAVNSFNLPYYSGMLAGGIILIAAIVTGLVIAFQKKKVLLYNALIFVSLIILGFSTYGVIVLRSHANTPVDMSNPEDPFALENYLNREQYGSRSLLYGPSFASPLTGEKERSSYERFNGKYVQEPLVPDYTYDENTLMPFPRMSSTTPGHAEAYKAWCNFKGVPYTCARQDGEQMLRLPTFGENLQFFFRYQLGFMYFRYFMWNFVGKQDDVQGHGELLHGNWLSGIPFIDNILLGPQDKLPDNQKQNKGRNTYFFLPLLLGLAGLVFQFRRDPKNFSVISLLFFFTGIALVLYLNEVPVTPRERDYVYVGSFYAFCIWIGIGILALMHWMESRRFKAIIPATLLLAVPVPLLMASQNWDDHNRSHRYHVRDYALNYLESCAPNAILFTNADNDTYPLWYAQEVEGIRPDVQIVLLPYLAADWYVNQMRHALLPKQGLKMQLTEDKIVSGKRTYLPVKSRTDSSLDVNQVIAFTLNDDPRTMLDLSNGQQTNYLPGRNLYLPAGSKAAAHLFGNLKPADSVKIHVAGDYITLDNLVLLDILSSNQWQRPVYFASVQVPQQLGLDRYLQLDGTAYRLVPYQSNPEKGAEPGIVNSDRLFQQYMHDFAWSSLNDPKVYLDYTHRYTLRTISLREKFARLAEVLFNEGKKEKAVEVLDRITTLLPNGRLDFDYSVIPFAELYFLCEKPDKGTGILQTLSDNIRQNLRYFCSLSPMQRAGLENDIRMNLYTLQNTYQLADKYSIQKIKQELENCWLTNGQRLSVN